MNKSFECFAPALMREIRDRFAYVDRDPFVGQRIFFESAGGTLRLRSVIDVTQEYTGYPDNDGRDNDASRALSEVLEKGRKDVALLLGVKTGTIISDQTTTSIIFRILTTMVLDGVRRIKKQGGGKGNIVASNLDHPATYDSARVLAARFGLEFRTAELDPTTGTVPSEAVLSQVDENTVALAMIHASNITGTRNDIITISNLVKKKNPETLILIDGAQHACHGVIDVDAYGVDAYVFVPYKIYSKIGTSFAHLSSRMAVLPHDKLIGKKEDQWDLGTREPAAFASMSKLVEYYIWLGGHFSESEDPRRMVLAAMEAIESHEHALVSILFHGTDDLPGLLHTQNLTVLGQTESIGTHESIISFTYEGKSSEEIVAYFNKNGIRLHNRISNAYSKHILDAFGIKECVRLSLCHYNNEEEVIRFLSLLNELEM